MDEGAAGDGAAGAGAASQGAASQGAAEKHTWVVESIAGVPTIEPKPQISLLEDGSLVGTTGVNRIRGRYEAHGEGLRITGTGMTRRAGPPEAMDQERRFLSTLEGWQAFRFGEGRLELGPVDALTLLVLADPAQAG